MHSTSMPSCGKETLRLLVTGIPGSGKTRFGEYLASAHGFVHRDLEDATEFAEFVDNPLTYLFRLSAEGKKSVITWGFVPVLCQIELVRSIGKRGFGIVWFDGDRPAALRAFQRRGTTPEANFYLQMHRIESSRALELIGPIRINTFDEHGGFKEPVAIFDEIQRALAASSVRT